MSQRDLFGDVPLPQPPPRRAFDGATYDADRDYARLNAQQRRVFDLMKDGQWRTLGQISEATGDPEASVSARLRDLRKAKYGGFEIERKHIVGGLYRYRMVNE